MTKIRLETYAENSFREIYAQNSFSELRLETYSLYDFKILLNTTCCLETILKSPILKLSI